MAELNLEKPIHRFGYSSRKDAWWIKPLLTFIGLSAFVIYTTWAAFQGVHYHYGLIFHRFIPPNFLEIHHIAGSDQSSTGGQTGCPGRLHF